VSVLAGVASGSFSFNSYLQVLAMCVRGVLQFGSGASTLAMMALEKPVPPCVNTHSDF
jgi:hypothetical protein